ncbi:MAG: gluconate 2-dehydrogenase subunit 3 family protein [Deltaproteobacteria bacterium]|nr:gluconate 2-dehydrogenase subunit 3 family protein [Deltaproteobacteria bacterium]
MDIVELMNDAAGKGLNRREFFQWLGRATVIVSLFGLMDQLGCGSVPKAGQQSSMGMVPVTEDEKTVYAVCDTILPGRDSDPTGAPGAVDVGTFEFVYDKFYGVVQFLPVILSLINAEAQKDYGNKFYELGLEQRTTVLRNVETTLGIVDQVYMFMKGPFYIGITSRLGMDYMGDPGPNLGYVNHDFSFYRPMSGEMTSDGNLP